MSSAGANHIGVGTSWIFCTVATLMRVQFSCRGPPLINKSATYKLPLNAFFRAETFESGVFRATLGGRLKGPFAQLLEQNSTRSAHFWICPAFVFDLLSYNFLSMIFGLLGKFGIDIGKKYFQTYFFEMKKISKHFRKIFFQKKKSNGFDFF